MPDELLNGIPTPRAFNVLHQLAIMRDEGDEVQAAVLQRLISAGCRFDTAVRSMPSAGLVPARNEHGQTIKFSGARLSARDIAELGDCQRFSAMLDTRPAYSSGAHLTNTQSVKQPPTGGGGGGGGGGAQLRERSKPNPYI
jgi:hypothetical protein